MAWSKKVSKNVMMETILRQTHADPIVSGPDVVTVLFRRVLKSVIMQMPMTVPLA